MLFFGCLVRTVFPVIDATKMLLLTEHIGVLLLIRFIAFILMDILLYFAAVVVEATYLWLLLFCGSLETHKFLLLRVLVWKWS